MTLRCFPVESLEERLYYNLLPLSHRQEGQKWQCTVELINTLKLQQDHPWVIDIINYLLLHRPNVIHISYRLDIDNDIETSVGQARAILRLLLLQVI